MRANEFVIEGPVDKFGDVLQKQVIGRKQQKQAKAQKENIPKIVKLLQQNLAAKTNQLIKKYGNNDPKRLAAALNDMVIDTLNKSLDSVKGKSKSKDKEEDVKEAVETSDLTAIADAVLDNPTGVATDRRITQLLQKAVTKSFASPEPEVPDTTGDEEPQSQPPADVSDLQDEIKDALLVNPDHIMKMDPDDIVDYIRRQLDRNNVTDNDEIDSIVDALMNDPDMPFNYEPTSNFRGLVYSPNGTRYLKGEDDKNIAFVKNSGRWSQWVIGPSSTWKYSSPITDSDQVKQLDVLAKQATSDIVPMNFRIDDTEGVSGMFRVSAR